MPTPLHAPSVPSEDAGLKNLENGSSLLAALCGEFGPTARVSWSQCTQNCTCSQARPSTRPEMAHEMIRERLFSCEASLLPEPRRGILRVRLPRQAQSHLDEALEPVLQALNEAGTVYPRTDLRLVYEFNGG